MARAWQAALLVLAGMALGAPPDPTMAAGQAPEVGRRSLQLPGLDTPEVERADTKFGSRLGKLRAARSARIRGLQDKLHKLTMKPDDVYKLDFDLPVRVQDTPKGSSAVAKAAPGSQRDSSAARRARSLAMGMRDAESALVLSHLSAQAPHLMHFQDESTLMAGRAPPASNAPHSGDLQQGQLQSGPLQLIQLQPAASGSAWTQLSEPSAANYGERRPRVTGPSQRMPSNLHNLLAGDMGSAGELPDEGQQVGPQPTMGQRPLPSTSREQVADYEQVPPALESTNDEHKLVVEHHHELEHPTHQHHEHEYQHKRPQHGPHQHHHQHHHHHHHSETHLAKEASHESKAHVHAQPVHLEIHIKKSKTKKKHKEKTKSKGKEKGEEITIKLKQKHPKADHEAGEHEGGEHEGEGEEMARAAPEAVEDQKSLVEPEEQSEAGPAEGEPQKGAKLAPVEREDHEPEHHHSKDCHHAKEQKGLSHYGFEINTSEVPKHNAEQHMDAHQDEHHEQHEHKSEEHKPEEKQEAEVKHEGEEAQKEKGEEEKAGEKGEEKQEEKKEEKAEEEKHEEKGEEKQVEKQEEKAEEKPEEKQEEKPAEEKKEEAGGEEEKKEEAGGEEEKKEGAGEEAEPQQKEHKEPEKHKPQKQAEEQHHKKHHKKPEPKKPEKEHKPEHKEPPKKKQHPHKEPPKEHKEPPKEHKEHKEPHKEPKEHNQPEVHQHKKPKPAKHGKHEVHQHKQYEHHQHMALHKQPALPPDEMVLLTDHGMGHHGHELAHDGGFELAQPEYHSPHHHHHHHHHGHHDHHGHHHDHHDHHGHHNPNKHWHDKPSQYEAGAFVIEDHSELDRYHRAHPESMSLHSEESVSNHPHGKGLSPIGITNLMRAFSAPEPQSSSDKFDTGVEASGEAAAHGSDGVEASKEASGRPKQADPKLKNNKHKPSSNTAKQGAATGDPKPAKAAASMSDD